MSRNPPLAGRPPFATDEPDSVYYDSNQSTTRRVRQPPPPNPNDRTSAYDLYDDYMDDTDEPPQAQDKHARLAAATNQQIQQRLAPPQSQPRPQQPQQQPQQRQQHPQQLMPQQRSPQPPMQQLRSPQPPHQQLRSPQPSPQPQRSPQPQQYQQQQQQQQPMYQPQPRQPQQPMPNPHLRQQQVPIPLAAPQPGYAAPIATLNMSRPPPIHTNQPQLPSPQFRNEYPPSPASSSLYPPSSPSIASPHPLQAPSTPITPVFVATPRSEKVKFANESPIIRGNSEETLIPKRGQKGDEFWRRFSMIAKVEESKPATQKDSTWLKKTESGNSSFSKWVWIIGVFLLLCIGGGIGVGWWATHNENGHSRPGTIDGAANVPGANSTAIPTTTSFIAPPTSVRPTKVTPTNTVARRAVGELPSGLGKRHHHHINRML